MFFHSLQASFVKESSESQSPTKTPLRIPVEFGKLIKKIQELSAQIFKDKKEFLNDFLIKLFRVENEALKLDLKEFLFSIEIHKFKEVDIRQYLDCWLHHELSPISILLDIWSPYVQFQISQSQNVHQYLSQQIRKMALLVICLLKEFIPLLHNQKLALEFEFKLLNRISKGSIFKQVMKIYLAKFDRKKGSEGEFTRSEIFQSVRQLDGLVNFGHIPEPFNKSIQHMILFFEEHGLRKKIKWLVEAVNSVKEEINQYREEYNMGSTAIGSDQMFPVVNYVCEKTHKNILAGVSFINAFFGPELSHRDKMITEIGSQAGYCLQLVEAVSGVYCHASQFIQ